jgi:hypothetical protein
MTNRILIEVSGGRVQAIHALEGLEIIIVDHDDDMDDKIKHSKEILYPDSVCTKEGLETILKEILEDTDD